MSATNQIELKIDHHPSGRYTLKRREEAKGMFHDYVEAGLCAQSNPEVFLKAFYVKLQTLFASGTVVTLAHFPDTTTAEGAS